MVAHLVLAAVQSRYLLGVDIAFIEQGNIGVLVALAEKAHLDHTGIRIREGNRTAEDNQQREHDRPTESTLVPVKLDIAGAEDGPETLHLSPSGRGRSI